MKKLLTLAAIVAMAGSVQAAILGWGGAEAGAGGDGTTWADGNNWFDFTNGGTAAPTSGDQVNIGGSVWGATTQPTVSSAGQVAGDLILGNTLASQLDINVGGDLAVAGIFYVGNDGTGTLNMNGGTLTAATMQWANAGQVGHINLHGGTINATTANLEGTGLTTMDVQGTGKMIVGGNQTGGFDFLIGNGWITGGAGLASSYDSGSDTTTLAIPEPATFGMVAAMGGGILFIRRKFMI